VPKELISDIVNGLMAVLRVKEPIRVQHIVAHAIQKRCFARANIADDANKLALLNVQCNLLEYQEVLQGLVSAILLSWVLCQRLV